ncbi:MAG: DNA-3-methyladenine glycosylase 2 family protein [Gammaproteobacteria bacterium]|nr:DNA-3-methyladenine glycosylase 2 family protein [Gammaproteobacteria bacterium]
MTQEPLIQTEDCIQQGLAWLAQEQPRFKNAIEITEDIPLRLRDEGFKQLLNAIVSQQLSVSSANSIWNRIEDAKLDTPKAITAASDEDLRNAGFSRQKVSYARSLAEANIDYASLRAQDTATVISSLTKIKGIGAWTAEIYLIFSLGRQDVFAPGDLALQEATLSLFELSSRPTEKELRALSESWSPWRSIAARLLWAYYKKIKSREGIR